MVVICAATACTTMLVLFSVSRGPAIKRAKEEYEEFMRLPLYHLARGNEHLKEEEYSAAAREFREALRHYPDWDIAEGNLAVALKRADPDTWLEEHPHDDDTRLLIWSGLLNEGEYREAREHAQLMHDPITRKRCIELTQQACTASGRHLKWGSHASGGANR